MTVTYDPKDAAYWDESDLRDELTRVYDLCHGCRMCFNLCPAFPTLFDYADKHDGQVHKMTSAEQDHVVDECYGCKLCYVKCPYVPPHEWELDFPRLMMRAEAVRHRDKRDGTALERLAKHAMNHTDLAGKVSTRAAPVVNRLIASGTGGVVRKVMEQVSGIAADRLLPPYAKVRFSTWFRKRPRRGDGERQAAVAIFPSCFVEYMQPAIGKDLVKVYERNRVDCELAGTIACCGAPMLHGGDVDGFVAAASKTVSKLAESVRAGRDIVVPQPTCGYVLKQDFPRCVGGAEAELVAENTYDAAEYLVRLHRGEATSLDTEFGGDVPEEITYHVPCHLQAQNIGLKSRDLMKLTGTKITLVNKCSGIDGTWGYRAANYDLARKVAQPMAEAIANAANDVVTGDCHLANGAIVEETGKRPVHPIQFVARAYGIPPEDPDDGAWGSSAG